MWLPCSKTLSVSHVAVVLKEMWFNFIDPSACVGRGMPFPDARESDRGF